MPYSGHLLEWMKLDPEADIAARDAFSSHVG
jgi:hypothetical protein